MLTDLAALRAFVATARSFALATRTTGLTRSALGKAVSRLEEQLGSRLLQRKTRRVELTGDGELFLARCEDALRDLDDAAASLRQDHPTGTLRLTVPDAFGRLRILPVLDEYLRAWPDLKTEVSFSDRVADVIAEGYDLAIRIGAVGSSSEVVSRTIAHFTTVLCASSDYLARRSHARLADHRRLAFGVPRHALPWVLTSPAGEIVTVSHPPALLFHSAEALRDAALRGLGVAALPDFLVADALATDHLVAVLPDHHGERSPVHALYPSRRHPPPRVRLFLDLLVRRLRRR